MTFNIFNGIYEYYTAMLPLFCGRFSASVLWSFFWVQMLARGCLLCTISLLGLRVIMPLGPCLTVCGKRVQCLVIN